MTSGGTTTAINDVYALGHLAYQTDGSGTILATFTFDTNGTPTSVTLGSGSGFPRVMVVETLPSPLRYHVRSIHP